MKTHQPGRFAGLLIVLVLVTPLAACGQPEDNPAPSAEAGATSEPGVTDQVAATSAPERPAGERLMNVPGAEELTLTTPKENAGLKPLLAWEEVDGAARYGLVVYDPEGHAYWAWEGAAESVYLGGGETSPSPDSAGPVLMAGMTWGVLAYDADGNIIAVSREQAISP